MRSWWGTTLQNRHRARGLNAQSARSKVVDQLVAKGCEFIAVNSTHTTLRPPNGGRGYLFVLARGVIRAGQTLACAKTISIDEI